MTVESPRNSYGPPARKLLERLRHAAHREQSLLRVASYNIHGCVGSDSRYDAERVAQVIRELGCDTVGLQEVDCRPGMLSDSMQLEFLASATGMTAVAAAMQVGNRREYGNALLTLREVLAVRQHDLTFKGCEARSVLDVSLRVGRGILRVVVTHLGLRGAERRFQVKKLVTLLRAIPQEQPVIVLGDINEWLPLGRPLRWLHRALGKSPSPRSFPVWAPVFAFDRIWARAPATLVALDSHRTARSRRASHHFPIKATVAANVALRTARRSI